MNIFATNIDPAISAQELDDKRVVKMIIESSSLLAVSMDIHNAPESALPFNKQGNRYSTKGWRYHGCTIWCSKNKHNYRWLLLHLIAMLEEYTFRYGKVHYVSSQIQFLIDGENYIPDGALTPFYNGTIFLKESTKKGDFIDFDLATNTYKKFMISKFIDENRKPTKWTKRLPPNWCINNIDFIKRYTIYATTL